MRRSRNATLVPLLATLSSMVFPLAAGCNSEAKKQSRIILEAHKDEFKECSMAAKDLMSALNQDIGKMSEAQLRMYTDSLSRKTTAFESEECLESVLSTVDQERKTAGIDKQVFDGVFQDTMDEWEEEWGMPDSLK